MNKNKKDTIKILSYKSFFEPNILDTEEWVACYSDGRKLRFTVKSLFPLQEEEPLFSCFGQMVYNDYIEKA